MEIILPDFNGAIEFLLKSISDIYTALYTLFNNDTVWSVLGYRVEFTIPNIMGGEDIVVQFGILTMLFSYGLASFIIFTLAKWIFSGIK